MGQLCRYSMSSLLAGVGQLSQLAKLWLGLSGIFGTGTRYPVHHTVSGFNAPVANIMHRITLTVAYMQYDVL